MATTTAQLIRDALMGDAAVVALVVARVFPSLAPQGLDLAHVVMRVISDIPENSLNGTSVGRLTEIRMQIDSYAKTYLEAHAVADAVDAVVSALQSSDLGAQRIGGRDLYDNEAQLHCASSDFAVFR